MGEVVPSVLDDLCDRLDIGRGSWIVEHSEELREVDGRTLVDVFVVNEVLDIVERGGGVGFFQEGGEARFDDCTTAENIHYFIRWRHGVNVRWLLLVDLITATELRAPVLLSKGWINCSTSTTSAWLALPLRLAQACQRDPAFSHMPIFWVAFDADEVTAEHAACDPGRTTTHERIEDRIAGLRE